jgi:hypothetical protein
VLDYSIKRSIDDKAKSRGLRSRVKRIVILLERFRRPSHRRQHPTLILAKNRIPRNVGRAQALTAAVDIDGCLSEQLNRAQLIVSSESRPRRAFPHIQHDRLQSLRVYSAARRLRARPASLRRAQDAGALRVCWCPRCRRSPRCPHRGGDHSHGCDGRCWGL